MTRKELEALGLSKENIDAIMSLHGVDVTNHQQTLQAKTNELETANAKVNELSALIKKFDGVDLDKLKAEPAEIEAKYKGLLAEKDFDYATELLFNRVEFTSDLAKQAAIADFKSKKLPLDQGKFLGSDDYLKALKESNPAAFKEVTNPEDKKPGTKAVVFGKDKQDKAAPEGDGPKEMPVFF